MEKSADYVRRTRPSDANKITRGIPLLIDELNDIMDELSISDDADFRKIIDNGKYNMDNLYRICVSVLQGKKIQQVRLETRTLSCDH